MRAAGLSILLLCLAVSAPAAFAQSCATGYIQVCITPVACACVLPGNGVSDPIMRDFSGHQFEFFGEAGSFYNLYSDQSHQVNMKLFPGFVEGHNGTYMGDFGIAFHDFRVNVSLLSDGDMIVETWESGAEDDKRALAVSGEATRQIVGQKNGVTMTVTSDPFREFHGRVIEVTTNVLDLSIWSIPPGTKDSKGVEQPAYLNFNLTLSSSPAGDVAEGIIGESLHKVLQRQKEKAANLFADSTPDSENTESFNGKGLTNDYRVNSLFGTDFAFNRFGSGAAEIVARRFLMTSKFGSLPYPIQSTTAA